MGKVPGPGQYDGKLLNSRKAIKIGEKVNDAKGLNVPGPGVTLNYISVLRK